MWDHHSITNAPWIKLSWQMHRFIFRVSSTVLWHIGKIISYQIRKTSNIRIPAALQLIHFQPRQGESALSLQQKLVAYTAGTGCLRCLRHGTFYNSNKPDSLTVYGRHNYQNCNSYSVTAKLYATCRRTTELTPYRRERFPLPPLCLNMFVVSIVDKLK